MKFGTSAAARVDSPKVVALPTSVRVGREPDVKVRVGQDPFVAPGYENGNVQADQRMRLRPLGSTPQDIPVGATVEFLFDPCEDCYVQNFVVPESKAPDASIVSIINCRISYFEAGEVPCEFFSNQGGTHLNRIFFGSAVKANIPIKVLVRNVGGAPLLNWNAAFLVSTAADCGAAGPLPLR